MKAGRFASTALAVAGGGLICLTLAGRARSDDPVKKGEPAAELTPARAAFERIKTLSGDWNSKSTKGWTEKESYQVIAGGSVVMHLSYGAHPGEWMATMFHMDGEHLMLTHYCVARNQPRLRATDFSDEGSKITFTFHDATNLPSRDKGHMDKHVMMFDAPDRMKTRWTWYQDGKESWMEEIEHRRAEAGPGAASK
ncbi:MAG TPA: hypothetical protein VJZ71_09105 [Phycisphaerae bacterium]|nr:hypothetical protein [Phycisphaerae bacterium]